MNARVQLLLRAEYEAIAARDVSVFDAAARRDAEIEAAGDALDRAATCIQIPGTESFYLPVKGGRVSIIYRRSGQAVEIDDVMGDSPE